MVKGLGPRGGSAAGATPLRNCAASLAKNCTPPTKTQIRAVQDTRNDAESACTEISLLAHPRDASAQARSFL